LGQFGIGEKDLAFSAQLGEQLSSTHTSAVVGAIRDRGALVKLGFLSVEALVKRPSKPKIVEASRLKKVCPAVFFFIFPRSRGPSSPALSSVTLGEMARYARVALNPLRKYSAMNFRSFGKNPTLSNFSLKVLPQQKSPFAGL